MRLNNIIRASMLSSILLGMVFFSTSCKEEMNGNFPQTGNASISGVISDTQGNTLPDVSISLKSTDTKKEVIARTQSASDGSFSFKNLPAVNRFLTFEKKGYSSVGITVMSSKLLAGNVELSPIMEFANAVIKGRVLDAQNGNAPFAGVKVSIGSLTVDTGTDGTFIFENLTIQEYILSCTKAGAAPYNKKLTPDLFGKEGIIDLGDISIGGKELLRGLTAQDLKDAPVWYVNEYRGGYGRGGGRIDWSTSFMSCQFFKWEGNWEMQNEGCTLRIRNKAEEQTSPADLENFDSFTYGKKLITNDNRIMSVNCRCHQATNEEPVYWGVQVIDLSEQEPKADLIGGVRKHPSGDYMTFRFDLSKYVGKEVIIAIGTFRAKTGDYWKQFCIAHVSFAPEANEGDNYLPGKAVAGLEGWNMTEEMVRSSMPNPRKNFIAYTLSGLQVYAKRNPAYHAWAGTGHIASEWAFQYVNHDIEPIANEGLIIRTRDGIPADYNVPEAYFYSKFAISSGNNKIALRVRNFSGTLATTFKFTVIQENGNVTFLDPSQHKAVSANKVDGGNGCWEFINEQGGIDTPNDYASFEYDLSKFNGESVMICIGIHKGQGGEQKLCFHSIDIL